MASPPHPCGQVWVVETMADPLSWTSLPRALSVVQALCLGSRDTPGILNSERGLCVCVQVHSVVSGSLKPHGLHGLAHQATVCSQNFPGKKTKVGCHFLLQGIFLNQGSNLVSLVSPALAEPSGELHTGALTSVKHLMGTVLSPGTQPYSNKAQLHRWNHCRGRTSVGASK